MKRRDSLRYKHSKHPNLKDSRHGLVGVLPTAEGWNPEVTFQRIL